MVTNQSLTNFRVNNDNPYFYIKVEARHFALEVRLNDIPVYRDDFKGQLEVEVPVSEYIVDGKNEFSIEVTLPYVDKKGTGREQFFEKDAMVRASIYADGLNSDAEQLLGTLSLTLDNQGRIYSSESDLERCELLFSHEAGSKVTMNFDLKSPFGRWKWQDGQDIDHKEETYLSLLEAYRKIHESFKNRDSSSIFSMYEERAREITVAYHLSGVDAGHEKLNTGKDMMNGNLQLYAFYEKNMELEVYAQGKLARIRNNYFRQPVLFLDHNTKTMHFHKFSFYKDATGQWVMIR